MAAQENKKKRVRFEDPPLETTTMPATPTLKLVPVPAHAFAGLETFNRLHFLLGKEREARKELQDRSKWSQHKQDTTPRQYHLDGAETIEKKRIIRTLQDPRSGILVATLADEYGVHVPMKIKIAEEQNWFGKDTSLVHILSPEWEQLKAQENLISVANWPPKTPEDLLTTSMNMNCASEACVGCALKRIKGRQIEECRCTETDIEDKWRNRTLARWHEWFELRATEIKTNKKNSTKDDIEVKVQVFATRHVELGRPLGEVIGVLRPDLSSTKQKQYRNLVPIGTRVEREEIQVHCSIDNEKYGNFTRFVGHSCEPNCHFVVSRYGKSRSIALMSKRVINPGDKITVDRGEDWTAENGCNCGADNCRMSKNSLRRSTRLRRA